MPLPTDYTNSTPSLDTHPGAHNQTNTTVNTLETTSATHTTDIAANTDAIAALTARVTDLENKMVLARNYNDDPLVYGLQTLDRRCGIVQAAMTTQQLRFSYIRAPLAMTVRAMRAQHQGAGTSVTLVRFGIYREEPNGDLTLIGSTANNAAYFNSVGAAGDELLTTPTALVKDTRYAFGVLIVFTGTAPTLAATQNITPPGAESAKAPRASAARNTVSDLPASITVAQLVNTNFTYHCVALP